MPGSKPYAIPCVCTLLLLAVPPASGAPADSCRELSEAKADRDAYLLQEAELLERIARTEEDLAAARLRAQHFVAPQPVDEARQLVESARGELAVIERRLDVTRERIRHLGTQLAAVGDPRSLEAVRDRREKAKESAEAAAAHVRSQMDAEMPTEAEHLQEIDEKIGHWAGLDARQQLLTEPQRIHADSFRGDRGSRLHDAIAAWEEFGVRDLQSVPDSTRAKAVRLQSAISDARQTIERLLAERVTASTIMERRRKALEPGLPEADRKTLAAADQAKRALEQAEQDLRLAEALDRQHRVALADQDQLERELNEARERVEAEQKRLEAALAGVKDPRDEVAELESRLASMRSALPDFRHALAEAEKRIATLGPRVAELAPQVEGLVDRASGEAGVASQRRRAGDTRECLAALARAWRLLDEADLRLRGSSCAGLAPLRARVKQGKTKVETASCDGHRIGDRLVEVPLVMGSQVEEAIGRLKQRGLVGQVGSGHPTTEKESVGLVVGQSRSHLEPVPVGTVVELEILTDALQIDHGDPGGSSSVVAPAQIDYVGEGMPDWTANAGAVETRSAGSSARDSEPHATESDPCAGPRPEYDAALARIDAAVQKRNWEELMAALYRRLPNGAICHGDAADYARLKKAALGVKEAETDALENKMARDSAQAKAQRQRSAAAWANLADEITRTIARRRASTSRSGSGGHTSGSGSSIGGSSTGGTGSGGNPGCTVRVQLLGSGEQAYFLVERTGVNAYLVISWSKQISDTDRQQGVYTPRDGVKYYLDRSGQGYRILKEYSSQAAAEAAGRGLCSR